MGGLDGKGRRGEEKEYNSLAGSLPKWPPSPPTWEARQLGHEAEHTWNTGTASRE